MSGGALKFRSAVLLIAVIFSLGVAGCTTRNKAPRLKVDPELLRLSKDEAFAKAEKLFEAKKYPRARTYYGHVYENYPNDPLGRRSLLRVADTYYRQGNDLNLIEAQYKYRDFINRYPGSEAGDYALLQIAKVSYKQIETPDRDQTRTREAISKFREMIAAYPNSPLRPEAEEMLQKGLDRLARHELLVARFYMKRKRYESAVARLNAAVEQYPNYGERDAIFFDLATSLSALGRKGEARLYLERVVAEFPQSDFAKKAKQRLAENKA